MLNIIIIQYSMLDALEIEKCNQSNDWIRKKLQAATFAISIVCGPKGLRQPNINIKWYNFGIFMNQLFKIFHEFVFKVSFKYK